MLQEDLFISDYAAISRLFQFIVMKHLQETKSRTFDPR